MDNGRSLGIVTTSLSSIGDCRRCFDGRSFCNLYRLCKEKNIIVLTDAVVKKLTNNAELTI